MCHCITAENFEAVFKIAAVRHIGFMKSWGPVCAIFVIFKMAAAAILNFHKFQIFNGLYFVQGQYTLSS